MSDAAPSPNHPSGNDSLPDEYGVPKVPCTDLGDSPSAQSAAADSGSGSRSAVEGPHDNGSLEAQGAGLGVAVVANASVPVYSGGLMVTSVRSSASTTSTRLGSLYAIEVPPDPLREYQAQQRFTLLAIDQFLEWKSSFEERAKGTVEHHDRHLRKVFVEPLVMDTELGPRALTFLDLMMPGHGRAAMLVLRKILDNWLSSPELVYDVLHSLKVFLEWLAASYVLKDGTDLCARYGVLACPLRDGEIPNRRPKRPHGLPDDEGVRRICNFLLAEWIPARLASGDGRRHAHCHYRNVVMFILALMTGMRGGEIRVLRVPDQIAFDTQGKLHLRGEETKTGHSRDPMVDSGGREILKWWLDDGRARFLGRRLAPVTRFSRIFPADGRPDTQPMGETTFYNAMAPIMEALVEQHLVLPEFTFHDCRKTYASNYVARGGALWALMDQCGWADSSTLAHYIRHNSGVLANERNAFNATLRRRRRVA